MLDKVPETVSAFNDDLEASLNYLRFPLNHRKGQLTSNCIDRLFEELKRRTKVVPRFFDEKSCLKPVFATLIKAVRGFRPFAINELALAQLGALMKEKKLQPIPNLDYEPANIPARRPDATIITSLSALDLEGGKNDDESGNSS